MKTNPSCIALTGIVITLMVGCAAVPAPGRELKNVALIMSGDVVSYASADVGTRISVVDVDGKPVKEPYGPIELEPGTHTVTLKCDGSLKTSTVTVAAGEVYQFSKLTTPGVKGCVGSLSRLRSVNP
jgi:hypothetical protein